MKFRPGTAGTCILILLFLAVGGCTFFSAGQRPQTRFYMLSSLASCDQPAQPLAMLPHVALGIGPVRPAPYLDRRNIIVRNSRSEFELVELSQWAEPLQDMFARVTADNLSVLLGTNRVVLFPWRSSMPVDYQVTLQVAQFDGLLGEQVVLRAHWQVFTGDGIKLMDSGYSVIEDKVEDGSIEALVAAGSRAAERLSQAIAKAIARLAR
jgi:uncharacterized lipoprotein YmbA